MAIAQHSAMRLLKKAKRVLTRYEDSDVIGRTPFYQRYPYTGGIPIFSADARGVVDHQVGIFFNRIPKSANSTVVANIVRLAFGDDASSLDPKRVFPRPSRLSADQVREFSNLYKFTFVRNPLSRTLSAYLDKVVREGYFRGKSPGVKPSREFIKKWGEQAPSFRDFCSYLEQEGLYSNIHWAPQTSLLLIPYEEFDFVGKLETFDGDFRHVMDRIFPENTAYEATTHGPPATSASRRMNEYYDDYSHDIVARLFKNDFEILGYSVS